MLLGRTLSNKARDALRSNVFVFLWEKFSYNRVSAV